MVIGSIPIWRAAKRREPITIITRGGWAEERSDGVTRDLAS